MKPLPGLEVANLESVPSPSLLVWPGRVQSNIERMIELCGGPERLRPHVKTHKMDAVVRLQLAAGIEKFKASTIAEVEMCLAAGARDVLLAYPVVGPGQDRLVRLALAYPHVRLAFLVDSVEVLSGMIAPCLAAGVELAAFVDFDCGMARTGICSVDDAISLVEAITVANWSDFSKWKDLPWKSRGNEYEEYNHFHLAYTDLLIRKGLHTDAINYINSIMTLSPRNVPITMGYSLTELNYGNPKKAHQVLLDLFNNVTPSPSQIMLIAKTANAAEDYADSFSYMAEYYLSIGLFYDATEQLRLALSVESINEIQKAKFIARLQEIEEFIEENEMDRKKGGSKGKRTEF